MSLRGVQRLTESCWNVYEKITVATSNTVRSSRLRQQQQPRRSFSSALKRDQTASPCHQQLQKCPGGTAYNTGRINYGTVITRGLPKFQQFRRTFLNEIQQPFHEAISRPRGTHLKSGAVRERPDKIVSFGRSGAFLLVWGFVYVGGLASSVGARLLHDYEIFELPDDDDFE